MEKRIFLSLLSSVMFLSVSNAKAHTYHNRHNMTKYHTNYHQQRDYYPQQPHYLQPPEHHDTRYGVLGSVLGYEIAKDSSITPGLGAVSESYLNRMPKKH